MYILYIAQDFRIVNFNLILSVNWSIYFLLCLNELFAASCSPVSVCVLCSFKSLQLYSFTYGQSCTRYTEGGQVCTWKPMTCSVPERCLGDPVMSSSVCGSSVAMFHSLLDVNVITYVLELF